MILGATIIIFWTSKNSCSILWLSGGKGQGKPNKTAVSADTANDTDLIQKQLKLHGLYELHSILYMLKVTENTGRENI